MTQWSLGRRRRRRVRYVQDLTLWDRLLDWFGNGPSGWGLSGCGEA